MGGYSLSIQLWSMGKRREVSYGGRGGRLAENGFSII